MTDDKETLYCDNQHWGYFYAYHNTGLVIKLDLLILSSHVGIGGH